MNSFKPFIVIAFAVIIAMIYITAGNRVNFYTQSVFKNKEKVHSQNDRLNRLRHSIADRLSEKASSYHMVKIPVSDMPADENDTENMESGKDIVALASSRK